MRCSNCGWENAEGTLRCVKCNKELAPKQTSFNGLSRPIVPASEGCCTACGYLLTVWSLTCPFCGATVTRHRHTVMDVGASSRALASEEAGTFFRLVPISGGEEILLRVGGTVTISGHKYLFKE